MICRYEREMLKKERGEKEKMPLVFLSLGLYLADFVKARGERSIEETRYDDLLLRRREEVRYGEALTYARIFLVLFAGILVTVFLALAKRGEDGVRELLRPDFGRQNTVSLKAMIGEDEENLLVSVSGRDPGGEALEAVLEEAFESLAEDCLGDNASLDNVTASMHFPSENDQGIRFTYRSNDPDSLSDYGVLLADEFPETGIPVEVEVTAAYGGMERTFCLSLTLRERVEELTILEKLERAVQKADEAGKSGSALVLPSEVDGIGVTYRQSGISPWLPLGVSLAAAVLLFFLPKEKEKEKKKARSAELEMSYPQLLSKLDTLIHAGMSIRSAWTRIVREYREGRKGGERKKEYAYEEMSLTLLRLEQGENEGEAYEEFGRRCTLRSYRKLGNLLGQNLRQGISGLEGALEEEMEKALEERKNRALRAGEEAGTKLLFPMILMLGIVVVTLVVPAFLSF